MEECARMNCDKPAVALLTFSAREAKAWLYDLHQPDSTGGLMLCRKHANATVVPMSWQLLDGRDPAWPGPAGLQPESAPASPVAEIPTDRTGRFSAPERSESRRSTELHPGRAADPFGTRPTSGDTSPGDTSPGDPGSAVAHAADTEFAASPELIPMTQAAIAEIPEIPVVETVPAAPARPAAAPTAPAAPTGPTVPVAPAGPTVSTVPSLPGLPEVQAAPVHIEQPQPAVTPVQPDNRPMIAPPPVVHRTQAPTKPTADPTLFQLSLGDLPSPSGY